MADVRAAKERAEELLRLHGVKHPPVDVRAIAEREGIHILFDELEDEISGFIVKKGPATSIGVNAAHHPHRQRFTLAHELGHYRLHIAMSQEPTTVYVDAEQTQIHFRVDFTVSANNDREIEANTFAASLLMPEAFVTDDLRGKSVSLHDESAVRLLSRRYGVSPQALTIRLMELGLIRNTANGS